MTRDEFDETYEQLQHASNRHAEISKDPEQWDELTESRAELDAARDANTSARQSIVSRRDYATPDHVQPGLGIEGGMSSRTRLMAGLGAVVFLGSVAAVAWLAIGVVDRPVFVDGPITESLVTDRPCQWVLEIPITNSTDETVRIEESHVIHEQRKHTLFLDQMNIASGQTDTLRAWLNTGSCPATLDEIDHGSLLLNWSAADGEIQTTKHRF